MTGAERRAPTWMQRAGLEWLFRLLQNPKRLSRRYLIRGPAILPLLWRLELRVRTAVISGGGIEALATQKALMTTNPGQAL
jgi:hypothetical protein